MNGFCVTTMARLGKIANIQSRSINPLGEIIPLNGCDCMVIMDNHADTSSFNQLENKAKMTVLDNCLGLINHSCTNLT